MASINSKNYTYEVRNNGLVVDRCQTHSKRRFYRRIRTLKWKNGHTKVHLRISYGKDKNVFGKFVNFYNHGEYTNPEELLNALTAFDE